MSSKMPTCMRGQCPRLFEKQTSLRLPKWVNSSSTEQTEGIGVRPIMEIFVATDSLCQTSDSIPGTLAPSSTYCQRGVCKRLWQLLQRRLRHLLQ